jgi:hypothetical protein
MRDPERDDRDYLHNILELLSHSYTKVCLDVVCVVIALDC